MAAQGFVTNIVQLQVLLDPTTHLSASKRLMFNKVFLSILYRRNVAYLTRTHNVVRVHP